MTEMISRRRCIINACVLIIITVAAACILSSQIWTQQNSINDYTTTPLGTQPVTVKALLRAGNNSQNVDYLQSNVGEYRNEHNVITKNSLNQVPPSVHHISSVLAKRFPLFMIIGFGKAGTKALYELLKLHPSLSGPYKERRFFSLHYSNGLESYLKGFTDPPVDGYTIEKSPDYIIHPQAAIRIVEAANYLGIDASRLKFIVVLRNPIDRAMSEYMEWNIQRLNSHSDRLPRFQDMVMKVDSQIDGSQPFINTSCYSDHIRNWLKEFSKEQMCYVDGDTFISDPYKEVHILEGCLGIKTFFTIENIVYDESRGFYCFQVKGKSCMGKNKGRKHPDIPRNALTTLEEYFRPWNEQLPELTGRQFSNWEYSTDP